MTSPMTDFACPDDRRVAIRLRVRLAGLARLLAASAVTAVVWVVSGGVAGAVDYTRVDYARSSITFVSRQMNVPMKGRFARFTAQVAIDPERPAAARASVEIDTASVESGVADGDAEARGKDWLDAGHFPKATFVATRVEAAGQGRYRVAGTLTIRGRSQPLVVPVTMRRDGEGLWFEGSFTLRRLAFGIGTGEWGDPSIVADEVPVNFRLYLRSS